MAKVPDISKAVQDAVRDAAVNSFDKNITESDLRNIGEKVRDRMLAQIAKGISPIEGRGRFPEYKSRTTAKGLRAQAKALGSAARKSKSKSKAAKLKAQAKSLRNAAASSQKKGYPDNLSAAALQKTGKKARPVNLKLYGDFLKALEVRVRSRVIELGFFTKSEIVKEQGHREGANGQYVRPIIPIDNEKFNAAIDAEIFKAIDQTVKRRF